MAKRVKVDVPGIDDMFDPNVFVDRLDNMEEPHQVIGQGL